MKHFTFRPLPAVYRLALAGIGVFLVVTSPLWAPVLLRRMSFFRVRRIEILGTRFVPASDILARLHVDTLASVWDPTAPLVIRVMTHPGIRSAVVHRKLPGTVVVDVTERWPIALVPTPGGMRAYDETGRLLPLDPAKTHVDAPVLVERDTMLLRLLASLRASRRPLYDRVSSAKRAASRDELVVELNTLPVRTMANVTLERLADVEPVESDLARRQLHATEIDLRFRDQMIARLP